jgi:hypothetical protein
MGDPSRVMFYEHHPFHGFASRVSRDHYCSVPSGLLKDSSWHQAVPPCRSMSITPESPPEILEFLAEGPGTGFLHKKRVPGGLLGALSRKRVPRIFLLSIKERVPDGILGAHFAACVIAVFLPLPWTQNPRCQGATEFPRFWP